jgi:negative modulator of initiation of replication
MKNVELNDETFESLQRLAAAKHLTPEKLLADLLGANRPVCGDYLLFHLTGGDLVKLADPADRYLALLAWVARNHATDFADFISHQANARRYLRMSQAETDAIRRQHVTRQIGGTHYWAVMNIDAATKGRFVRRLLEFIGCHDETVAEAIRVLQLTPTEPPHRLHLLSVA